MKISFSKKNINDPIFGVINIEDEFIYSIIQHPYFQRLMLIKQLGLSYLVHPSALHSRMSHSLGAMYLMSKVISYLRFKGNLITKKEEQSVLACILMHDLGHTPFSHTLENVLIKDICHEEISLLLMKKMNETLRKRNLNLTIDIFKNNYKKKFLYQLISSQLDVDRLDNLLRDSFFLGIEDLISINLECIIKTLDVRNNNLVVNIDGISFITDFLMSRKFMFWKVYFSKKVITIEKMLVSLFKRAQYLVQHRVKLIASPSLYYFLYQKVDKEMLENNFQTIEHFINLNDNDVISTIKVWTNHTDKILSLLSTRLLYCKLFKIEIKSLPFEDIFVEDKQKYIANKYQISFQEASYLILHDEIFINVYNEINSSINILYQNETVQNISKLSDIVNVQKFSKKIKKYYLCYVV